MSIAFANGLATARLIAKFKTRVCRNRYFKRLNFLGELTACLILLKEINMAGFMMITIICYYFPAVCPNVPFLQEQGGPFNANCNPAIPHSWSRESGKFEIYIDSALPKIAITPLLTHWSYCSLALSHRYIAKQKKVTRFVCLSRTMIMQLWRVAYTNR